MPHIPDSQHIADDPIFIAVDGIDMLFDISLDHFTLNFGPLLGVKAHIVGIFVEG